MNRDSLSRSYRINLPSSLTTAHSSTLGYSPRPPVLVCGTGCINISLADFLGSLIRIIIQLSEDSWYCHLSKRKQDLLCLPNSTDFNVLFRQYADLSLLRLYITINTSNGILTILPSASPFGYTLGPDLP